MSEDVLFEVNEGVALITLNRPEAHNTLSAGIIDGLGAAYQRCDADDAVRAVVITGSGRSFCAGADMSAGGETFDGGAVAVEISSCPPYLLALLSKLSMIIKALSTLPFVPAPSQSGVSGRF